jgi:hypothetical protein
MAGLKGGTTISGYPALHTGNIGSFNLGDVTFNNISAEHIVLGSNTKTSGTWINLLAGNGQNSGLRMREDTTDYGATIWYDAESNTLRFTTINASAETNAISIDRASGATTFHKDILLGGANTKLQVGGNNSLKIQTNSGYLEAGPRNSSWCHFHTDRPSFYFDKDIAINGTLRRYGGARDIGTSSERWGNIFLSGNVVTSGKISLASGGNIEVNNANARRTIILTAGGAIPRSDSPSSPFTVTRLTSNNVMLGTLNFSPGVQQLAQWNLVMPDNWDGGTLNAIFYWTASSGSGNVYWGIHGRAYGDNEALDQGRGTTQFVTDTFLAANRLHVSPPTANITLSGTPSGGSFVLIQVYREGAVANDTFTRTARLLAVKLEYGIKEYSD